VAVALNSHDQRGVAFCQRSQSLRVVVTDGPDVVPVGLHDSIVTK